MIRKLGYIMLVIAMTLGQPLTVFANTVKDGSQNDSLENNLEMTDVPVAEGFLSELADGNADRYEERQLIEDDQPSTATEENISTNGSGEHTETDSGIEADSSESSSEESSSEATLDSSTEDSHEESVDSSAEDSSKEDSHEESDEIVEGVWGTVPWTWDEETKTIVLEEGNAGTVATAPWKTYTSVTQIVVKAPVLLPVNSAVLFSDLSELMIIENGNNFNTSQVTTMASMFARLPKLKKVDVSNWDTSKVTNMFAMFRYAYGLEELDVSNWDTSNVTNMAEMFRELDNPASPVTPLTVLDVSKWKTGNVTDMRYMFGGKKNLTSLDVSNWTVSKVERMDGMFAGGFNRGNSSLSQLDVSNWNVSNVTNMNWMFENLPHLEVLDVSNWNTENVTSMLSMFYRRTSRSDLCLRPLRCGTSDSQV